MRFAAVAALVAACVGIAQAQNCPPVDPEQQKLREQACRAAGGKWSRWGVHDHLCGIYSCAERTRDGGKPCRNRADCEHLCVTDRPAVIGAEAPGRCTAVKTSFGCYVHVDAGRIVGRACVD
jgi:hypothetical protein